MSNDNIFKKIRCDICGRKIYEYNRYEHLRKHELLIASAEFRIVRKLIIDKHILPRKEQYPLAYKYYYEDIESLLDEHITPLYSKVIAEVNEMVRDGKEKDAVRLLRSVPSEIRDVVVNKTELPSNLRWLTYNIHIM